MFTKDKMKNFNGLLADKKIIWQKWKILVKKKIKKEMISS